MNIAFAINNSYTLQLCVVLTSLLENNSKTNNHIYIFSSNLSGDNKNKISKIINHHTNASISFVYHRSEQFESLKLNINYISVETYFRYIIADLLPDIDKCLYLDADLIVNGDISEFYNTDLGNNYCAGVQDGYISRTNHKTKIGLTNNDVYINAGVLLMNLVKLRADKISEKLFKNTKKLADKIEFQDQDIINITFRNHIKSVDICWNWTTDESLFQWETQKNARIIHFTGARKPWKLRCPNKKKELWKKYAEKAKKILRKKIKIGLLVDEFFGGGKTAFGGYGFLARRYIAKYIPCDDIKIDVLLGKGHRFYPSKWHVDGVNLYRLPRMHFLSRLFLWLKNYDIYLSIELTTDWVLKHEPRKDKKLILWIQDPRPKYEWEEIDTVSLFKEFNYYDQRIYDFVHYMNQQGKVKFLSQGYFLNSKACDLYRLPQNTSIQYLPNPVEIDPTFDVLTYKKKNNIIFLGRIESIKRGWLFCEIAKCMSEYDFYMLGSTFREKEKNDSIMQQYKNIKNLHFTGHVDGEEKDQYLKDAKILVNTSIHEALPISFLEALSYGVTLVSNRNPEDLTSKFGIWTGQINGNGFDKLDLYINAIKELMTNDKKRRKLAADGRKYVEQRHNVQHFQNDLRNIIYQKTRT